MREKKELTRILFTTYKKVGSSTGVWIFFIDTFLVKRAEGLKSVFKLEFFPDHR